MMQGLLNVMKLQARLATDSVSQVFGTVSSYDPNTYRAKALIGDDQTETTWLLIGAEWAGNGWGLIMPPAVGTLVLIEYLDELQEVGIITKRFYTASSRPPQGANAGEMWMVHQSGASIKFTNDGKASLADKAGSTVVLDGTGKAIITATEIDFVGGGGTAKGILQADCICKLDGQPHLMPSATVKATL